MNAPLVTCPCCGQPVPRGMFQSPSLVRDLDLTVQQATIVDLLESKHGGWVHMDQILFALYGDDPEGGPLCAESVARRQMSRARKQLRKAGFDIEPRWGGRGVRDSYRRLVRVDA